MNNATAATLAFLIISVFGADLLFNDTALLTFLGRRMIDLTEQIAFWR